MQFYFFYKKDTNFLQKFFSISILFLLLFLFIIITSAFVNKFKITEVHRIIEKTSSKQLINYKNKINSENLKGRIIILGFYDLNDYKYIKITDALNRIKSLYKDSVFSIDIISDSNKTENYKDLITNYTFSHNIKRPVVYDKDLILNKYFKLKEKSAGIVIVEPNGTTTKIYDFYDNVEDIKTNIKVIIDKNKNFNDSSLDSFLEKITHPNLLVESPTRIIYSDDFKYNSKTAVLFVSDSGNRKVFVTSLSGEILYQIGTGSSEKQDGEFEKASFCYPLGIDYDSKKGYLYVADTCNNSIRQIDFKNKKVSTLSLKNKKIIYPLDVHLYKENKLIVSDLNNSQILFYDLKNDNKRTSVEIETKDNNTMMGMHVYRDVLYTLISNSNNIHFLDLIKPKELKFQKFIEEGDAIMDLVTEELFNNLANIYVDDTGIYIIDSYADIIRKIDLNDESKTSDIYITNKDKDNIQFKNPIDIVGVKDRLYIIDNYNHRLITVNKNTDETQIINIKPSVFSEGVEKLGEYLPNLTYLSSRKISAGKDSILKLNFKKDWGITKSAPNTLYIFEFNNANNEAKLIKSFSSKEISKSEVNLPELKNNQIYYIQGTFYYCQNSKNSLCLIKSYKQKILAVQKNSKKLEIEFLYK